MRSARILPTLLVVLLVASPARGEARLLGADLRIEPASATTARVHAEFTIAGADRIEWLLAWFPGQNVSELRGQVNDRPVRIEVTGVPGSAQGLLRAPRAELLGVDDRTAPVRLRVTYRVTVPDGYAHRTPLPVPLAPPGGEQAAVRLVVVVPEGAEPLGSHFPRLQPGPERNARQLRADLAAVPAFVHVRIDGMDAPPEEAGPPIAGPDRRPGGGFGWNFWGFLVVAVGWCAAYFGWAVTANRREANGG